MSTMAAASCLLTSSSSSSSPYTLAKCFDSLISSSSSCPSSSKVSVFFPYYRKHHRQQQQQHACSLLSSPSPPSIRIPGRDFTVKAVVEEDEQQSAPIAAAAAADALLETQTQTETQQQRGGGGEDEDNDAAAAFRKPLSLCELYVCNLSRSCGIPELLNFFKPYGTVQSVEVPRNPETGVSRGCGYVTMSSVREAQAAIDALDGSDVDGREMRVRFSVDMSTNRENSEPLSSPPKKNLIFETPYKVYVGNLAWSVKPEDLRNHFIQFGTVVSVRVLHDRKAGKNRVYGFLSFSSAAELEAAMSMNGTEYCGRILLLRQVAKKN